MSTLASKRIAKLFSQKILDGELVPGERIRQEELAQMYGASRLPVREALRLLESEGLVTIVENTGAWVLSLTQQECLNLYEVRERIEPLLLRGSMHNLREEHFDRLEDLMVQMDPLADILHFMRADREFHWITYSAAPDGFLKETALRLWNMTQPYRRAFSLRQQSRGRDVIHFEHFLLLEALRRGDEQDAEELMAMHIRRTRELLADAPEIFAE